MLGEPLVTEAAEIAHAWPPWPEDANRDRNEEHAADDEPPSVQWECSSVSDLDRSRKLTMLTKDGEVARRGPLASALLWRGDWTDSSSDGLPPVGAKYYLG
jgi:hypothetical protein